METDDIDGLFGAATKSGVEYYQAYGMGLTYGHGVDGIVGPDTWSAMKSGRGAWAINEDAAGLKLTKYGC